MSTAPVPPTPPVPPGDFSAAPGWLLRVVRDQRVAFLGVGVFNTVFGYLLFATLLQVMGQDRYLVALVCAYVVSVLLAFVLHRYVVFKVRGHVLKDLWRFVTVYLVVLAVNLAALPLLVELAHLPVLPAQAMIVLVTSVISWLGHKHYSFRRPSTPGDARP